MVQRPIARRWLGINSIERKPTIAIIDRSTTTIIRIIVFSSVNIPGQADQDEDRHNTDNRYRNQKCLETQLGSIHARRFRSARILGILVRHCRLGRPAKCQRPTNRRMLGTTPRMVAAGFRRSLVASSVAHFNISHWCDASHCLSDDPDD